MGIELGTAALLGGGLGALGSYMGGKESRKGTDNATNMQWQQYNQMREDNAPFRENGLAAQNRLIGLMGLGEGQNQDTAMQDYINRISANGIRGLDASAAARGSLGSTGHLKDIGSYIGNNAYGDYYNRLAALSGTGQTATANMSQMGQGYANQIGQGVQNAGNARASSYLGIGNSLSNGLDQYMRYQGMNNGGYGGMAGNSNYNPNSLFWE